MTDLNAASDSCCEPTCCGGGDNEPSKKITESTSAEEIRAHVRTAYGGVASRAERGDVEGTSAERNRAYASQLGYSAKELDAAPEEANLGLGCGNPTALAALEPGQVVLDLGSGAGLDAFVAADQVGETGRVIGVDMTPEMLARARRLAVERGVADRVEFRQGIIEALPVVDDSVDVVISNCVINLSPNKDAVFREAFRVLKPGGTLAVSDILLTQPLDPDIRAMADLYAGCVAGALVVDDYLAGIERAGFTDITYSRTPAGDLLDCASDQVTTAAIATVGEERARSIADTIYSYKVRARVPNAATD